MFVRFKRIAGYFLLFICIKNTPLALGKDITSEVFSEKIIGKWTSNCQPNQVLQISVDKKIIVSQKVFLEVAKMPTNVPGGLNGGFFNQTSISYKIISYGGDDSCNSDNMLMIDVRDYGFYKIDPIILEKTDKTMSVFDTKTQLIAENIAVDGDNEMMLELLKTIKLDNKDKMIAASSKNSLLMMQYPKGFGSETPVQTHLFFGFINELGTSGQEVPVLFEVDALGKPLWKFDNDLDSGNLDPTSDPQSPATKDLSSLNLLVDKVFELKKATPVGADCEPKIIFRPINNGNELSGIFAHKYPVISEGNVIDLNNFFTLDFSIFNYESTNRNSSEKETAKTSLFTNSQELKIEFEFTKSKLSKSKDCSDGTANCDTKPVLTEYSKTKRILTLNLMNYDLTYFLSRFDDSLSISPMEKICNYALLNE